MKKISFLVMFLLGLFALLLWCCNLDTIKPPRDDDDNNTADIDDDDDNSAADVDDNNDDECSCKADTDCPDGFVCIDCICTQQGNDDDSADDDDDTTPDDDDTLPDDDDTLPDDDDNTTPDDDDIVPDDDDIVPDDDDTTPNPCEGMPDGTEVDAGDGCNICICRDGEMAECTLMIC